MPKKLTELQKNIFSHLLMTLDSFSNQENQKKYKEKVPFVHIPIELLAEWDEYHRLTSEKRDWFIVMFSEYEIEQMGRFEKYLMPIYKMRRIPDVPEIFNNRSWQIAMKEAKALHSLLSKKRMNADA